MGDDETYVCTACGQQKQEHALAVRDDGVVIAQSITDSYGDWTTCAAVDRDHWRQRAEALEKALQTINRGAWASVSAAEVYGMRDDTHLWQEVGEIAQDALAAPAPAAAPQDDSSEKRWHVSVNAVRSSPELRETMLRAVMTSMELSGLPVDRTRSVTLLEQALSGPPLIYPGADQAPALAICPSYVPAGHVCERCGYPPQDHRHEQAPAGEGSPSR